MMSLQEQNQIINTTALKSKKKKCIFGTSANPPTKAHRNIITFLASLNEFDEILVLPVFEHMFEQKRCDSKGNMSVNVSSFEDRLAMAQLNFSCISTSVVVSDMERQCFYHSMKENGQKRQRAGTAELLDFMKMNDKICGDIVEYCLVLGSDTFIDLMDYKWERSKDVIDNVEGRFLVISRQLKFPGEQVLHHELLEKKVDLLNQNFYGFNKPNARVFNVPDVNGVSSTDARLTVNEAVLKQILEPAIFRYVKQNKLYAFSSVGGALP
jgi:nicotinic acid mononucleotide adenylyltransferase